MKSPTLPLIAIVMFCLAGCATDVKTKSQENPGEPINASWNDSGDDRSIGFWLYNTTGSCPSIRNNPPIVVAPKNDKRGANAKDVNITDLAYCFAFFPKIPKSAINKCESGTISYLYLPDQNRYSGTYKLQFADGKAIAGDFLAEYCANDPE
jgi:hypothetical protein